MTMSERRIHNNKIRRQCQLRRNVLMMVFTAALILTFSIGGFAIGSKAQDKEEVILYKYYTNIEVGYGENLWDIAGTYFCEDKYDDYEHYISEVSGVVSIAGNDGDTITQDLVAKRIVKLEFSESNFLSLKRTCKDVTSNLCEVLKVQNLNKRRNKVLRLF